VEAEGGLIVARALHYGALLLLFGTALFPLHSLAPAEGRPAALDRRLGDIARTCAVLALASGVLWLMFTTAAMSGELAGAVAPEGLRMVLTGTPFGQIWAVRLAVLAVVAAAMLVVRWPPAVIAAVSGGLLASLALTGHAAVTEGAAGILHRISDALHLLAAGGWLGALVSMGYLVKRERFGEAAARALVRFAGAGSVFAAVLIATGLVNGWLVLKTPEPLLGGLYGRLLLVKVALVAFMLGLAGLNRFWLAPAFAADPEDKGARLRLTVGAEQALGLLVIVLVAVIGILDPSG